MKRAGILEWVKCLDRVVGLIEGEEDVGTEKGNVVPQRFISRCLDRVQNFERRLRLAFLKVNLREAVGCIGAYGLFDIAFENRPDVATGAAVLSNLALAGGRKSGHASLKSIFK